MSSFFSPSFLKGKEKIADARRKELAKDTKSDHLTVVNAFEVKKQLVLDCDSSFRLRADNRRGTYSLIKMCFIIRIKLSI